MVRADTSHHGVYLALGDSLATGVGATDPARLGYVPRLSDYFHGTAHAGTDTLLNVGEAGATSTTLVSGGQLTKAVAAIDDPTTDVRVVTLDIGGNDFLRLLAPGSPCSVNPNSLTCQQAVTTTLTTFAQNYTYILQQLTAALGREPGGGSIMVMTYYNFLSGTGNPLEATVNTVLLGADQKIDCGTPTATWGLNGIITCIGQQYGAVVADVYPRFVGKGPTLTHVAEGGDFHPNNAGYAIIANTFMRGGNS
jgi:lysophospholipase L1-like esterase